MVPELAEDLEGTRVFGLVERGKRRDRRPFESVPHGESVQLGARNGERHGSQQGLEVGSILSGEGRSRLRFRYGFHVHIVSGTP